MQNVLEGCNREKFTLVYQLHSKAEEMSVENPSVQPFRRKSDIMNESLCHSAIN